MTDPLDPAPIDEWKPFAQGAIRCPDCGQALPVPVLARMVEQSAGFGHTGTQKIVELTPQMDDVFAHWWAHGNGAGEQHCHHWSGWARILYTNEDAWLEHCHLPLAHSGPHSDGEHEWHEAGEPRDD